MGVEDEECLDAPSDAKETTNMYVPGPKSKKRDRFQLLVQFKEIQTGIQCPAYAIVAIRAAVARIKMYQRETKIDLVGLFGKLGGLFRPTLPVLRSLLLVDSQYAAYYRAFGLSIVFLVVGTGMIWWGDQGKHLELMLAGMLVFLLAETIWLGIGVVLLWKLARTVIDHFRAGQRGVPGKDRNRTLSDL